MCEPPHIHTIFPCLPSGFYSAVFVHDFSAAQLTNARKIYDEYGPTPRLCIEYALSPDLRSSYDASRQAILSDLSVDRLVEAVIHTFVLVSDNFIPSSLSGEWMTICLWTSLLNLSRIPSSSSLGTNSSKNCGRDNYKPATGNT